MRFVTTLDRMQTYGQFCPVAVAAEVFAHRWTPLILRELLAGSSHFNEIRRGLPLIPRTTLTGRLRALERAGVVTTEEVGSGRPKAYRLTPSGRGLGPVLQKLGEWGQQSTMRFEPGNLDPELLMWNIRRRIDVTRLTQRVLTLRFEFSGIPLGYRRTRVFWLLIDGSEVDLCVKDPGLDIDLYINADIGAFARVWLGSETMSHAIRDQRIRLTGARALVNAFPSCLLLSHFAAHGSAGVAAHA